jgi:hypothetical protein
MCIYKISLMNVLKSYLWLKIQLTLFTGSLTVSLPLLNTAMLDYMAMHVDPPYHTGLGDKWAQGIRAQAFLGVMDPLLKVGPKKWRASI